ncbi:hypothetical protein SAMN05443667_101256 [Flavobacterium gillisiae]|uniref:Uncharacterized protein n=1 Tax=Flavobacterium gillisiae TaxID=150146 RepID=A0A1H3WV66_9FLAO|nr:hypothetical protein [Flavobacterium gillisiae]SDZ91046.1 hypothetical protein SAMN05443667_101256 [Flavobacterium gillisiae]
MYNSVFFHTVLLFLGAISGQLSTQLQSDIATAKTTLNPQVLEIKKQITGGGTIDLIDATTNRIDGICSFDKNILQTGRAFVLDQISIGYAKDAATGKEGSLKYNIAAPAPLLNALFIINQNGREVLRMPVADLHNIAAGQNVNDQYTQLKSLCYLVDDKSITLQLKFAPGVVMDDTTDKHYVYLRLNGLQTSIKAS